MSDATDSVEFHYRRRGDMVRVTERGDQNEVRQVVIGIWADWPADVRLEFIAELAHYAVALAYPEAIPGRHLSPLAELVRAALAKERGVDLDVMRRAEFEDGPKT